MARKLLSFLILILLIGMLTLVSNVQPIKGDSTFDAESHPPPPPPPPSHPPTDDVLQIDIGLYWDEECTNRVYDIDFGKLKRGQSRYFTFWLKNEGTDRGRISWSSGNFYPSSNGITESWERKVGSFTYVSNWNKKMRAYDLWEVRYAIHIAQDIQINSYSWRLTVYWTINQRITRLIAPCILTVIE